MITFPNVGLIGKMRSGKDTVAAYLTQKYGYTRFAFGDALKDDFHRRYPEIPRDPKPRAGYQFHGQFMREHVDEDIWINTCLTKIDALDAELMYTDAPLNAVITDCRQLNEAEALRAAGYTLIRVEAPEAVCIQRAIASGDSFDMRALTHDTETALDGYAADFTVTNDAGLPELYAQIDEVMAVLHEGGVRPLDCEP
ncbi:AAA family ATPase [Paenibacillus macerans]|uniref:deoxynucleotide monophosphate kinase family protein n=1 Tax=Paenibacillus macerans TaxID=44252 RepID=UPI002DB91CE0|nr:AAA family ATPase [Paenibacillus macerans]MEC0328713.1 AAA family ATPase [Paenibacillus macerans]